jgi:hypothetical protein
VLELSRQVGSDEIGTGARIRDDHHLGRSGNAIHADRSEHLVLGQVHVDVAGAGDQVHARDGFCAVRHRRDRLRTAHPVNRVHAGDMGSRQDGSRDRAVRPRRRGQHHFAHAGDASRDRGHQDRGRIGGSAPRRVKARSPHRPGDQLESGHALFRRLQLSRVKFADALRGELQRFAISFVEMPRAANSRLMMCST